MPPTQGRSTEVSSASATTPQFADRFGLAAFALYLAVSALIFARGLIGHLSDYHIGVDIPPDATIFIWSLAWWRHAVLHHLNPLLTTAIWAPEGINLAWVTTAPLAAVLATPLTSAFGPVATCNLLFILSPALAAWTTFLLCRRITNSYWPAVLGGYIFGYSAYMLGQMQGHLHQVLIFPVPLLTYLVVRHYQGSIRTRTFVIASALTFAAEFLIALEVFATMFIFGALAIALSLTFSAPDVRKRIIATTLTLAAGLALAMILVSPFSYFLLISGTPHWGSMYSADPLGWLIPTTYFELGRVHLLQSIANRFPFDHFECDTYFGPVLIVIAALYARRHWHEPFARMMIDLLIIIAVLTLGPILHVMHHDLAGMPGAIVTRLPLMNKATPSRFTLYAYLILAIVSSVWIGELGSGAGPKIVISMLSVISTLPNLAAGYWVRPLNTPAFFSSGVYRKYLSPGETVVTLPYWMLGNGMAWQAQSDMYFRMAGGWTGPPPAEFDGWPIVKALATDTLVPEAEVQLKAFLANHGVTAVIAEGETKPSEGGTKPVEGGTKAIFRPLLASLDAAPVVTGGVTLYRIRPETLAPYRHLTALEMETRADSERLETLIVAANLYLAGGHDPAAIGAQALARLGLIPPGWVRDGPIIAFNALLISPWQHDGVSVGITGTYAALKPLIEKYRRDAQRIYFPFPTQLRDGAKVPTSSEVFVMMFDRAGLARAAGKASSGIRGAPNAHDGKASSIVAVDRMAPMAPISR
jgi:hypothetical protein